MDVPNRANNEKRKPKKSLNCWSCGDSIDVKNEGYHLVDGSPTCPKCMEEQERG